MSDLQLTDVDHVLRKVALRKKIDLFQSVAKEAPQVRLKLFHKFAPGLYLRELHIPAGIITVSKVHKHACMSILAKGVRKTVVGDRIELVKAPFIQLTEPGFKRISYTLEDAVWITVHPNPDDEREVSVLEPRFVCDTEEEYRTFVERKCLS